MKNYDDLLPARSRGIELNWPFSARTTDGGNTWDFVGWIGPPPDQGGYTIMPSSLRLKNGGLLSMIRRRGVVDEAERRSIKAFLLADGGYSWSLLDKPYRPNHGSPAHRIRLHDQLYGIRGMLRRDEGLTWSGEIMLRKNRHSWDLGSPRIAERGDGECVTTYDFNDQSGKERYVAATIWYPGSPASGAPSIQRSTVPK